jgi:outer membrane lipoprotein SlyB
MKVTVAAPGNCPAPQSAARPVSPLLYPTLLIAGISVIVASLLGIAAMTGLLPQAQSQPAVTAAVTGKAISEVQSAKNQAANGVPNQTTATKPSAQRSNDSKTAAAPCADCGVVESVRAIERKGEGSGVGAVAGGVVGGILGNQVGGGNGRKAMTVVGAGAGAYAGHELEKNMNRSVTYEIRVRMNDRSIRTFHSDHPDVGVGQRVTVRDGRLAVAG